MARPSLATRYRTHAVMRLSSQRPRVFACVHLSTNNRHYSRRAGGANAFHHRPRHVDSSDVPHLHAQYGWSNRTTTTTTTTTYKPNWKNHKILLSIRSIYVSVYRSPLTSSDVVELG